MQVSGLSFSVMTVLIFAALLCLRARFPVASNRSETVVVMLATVLFFGLCFLFLPHGAAGVH
jgi:hypothetical protein